MQDAGQGAKDELKTHQFEAETRLLLTQNAYNAYAKRIFYERKTRAYERTSAFYGVSTSFHHHHWHAVVIIIRVNAQANLIIQKRKNIKL